MRAHPSLRLSLFVIFLSILSCTSNESLKTHKKVSIRNDKGKYAIIRNGKLFTIKGASGFDHLAELKNVGGNTIRIWDTAHVDQILKEANKHGIAVIIGIPLLESRNLSYYNDTATVAKNFRKTKAFINRHKTNPAILMWCVGNELVFPNKPTYKNFYSAFNNIVNMIHLNDPDHPVTTTMINFQRNDIVNIKLRTHVDIISFNIFGKIVELKKDLEDFQWFWDGPYLITEWGVNGPWMYVKKTAWEAKIETTSTQKAIDYLERYKKYMPVDDPRFLGSFIFFWGQKQETTHTWFSLFDESGNKTEVVSIAQEIFTGKSPEFKGPKISDIVLAGKKATDNIFLKPQEVQSASIQLLTNVNGLSIKWEIYPEDWYKDNNNNNLVKPKEISGLIKLQGQQTVKFETPSTEGPYRLFVKVSDNNGNIANANIPFYVIVNDR